MSRETALKSEPLACTSSAFCALSAVILTSPLKSSAVSEPVGAAGAAARGGCPGIAEGIGAPTAGTFPFA